MMNCDKALSLLTDYLDGTLDPQVKQELEEHLESDPDCREVFTHAQTIQHSCQSMATVDCSEEFEVNLRNRIIEYNNGSEKKVLQNKKGLSLIFSATGLVIVFVVMMFSDIGNDTLPTQEEFNSSSAIEMKSAPEVEKVAQQEAIKDSLKKPDEINTDQIKTVNEKR